MAEQPAPTRRARKHQEILDAATALFLRQGYSGTSMDDIAREAAVSKQTVYQHFSDKEQLFADIVLGTTDQVEALVRLTGEALDMTTDLRADLGELARQFLATLMQPELLRLRRLVIATADHFPDVGRSWYEQGFERVLLTLAERFARLSDQRLLWVEDPLTAAHHFVGLLLWIPVNRAMFTGDETSHTDEQLDAYADTAVRAFLGAYGRPAVTTPTRDRPSSKRSA
ncbi:MAG: TetR/AcrR family transcriptional regulator [Acidimicrobiales bacterium]|nr:TetR/AcrR family transcriptional regulator [Acidimicrobiales bacterium]